MRRSISVIVSAVLGLSLGACHREPAAAADGRTPGSPATVTAPNAAPPAHSSRPAGVAWFDGDVTQAFAAAAEQGKPVFVYFGAVWCPPCQELKATVFKRQDFLRKLSLFVPVYLDGDAADAQRWAEEFNITGYPTVLILRGNRAELERVSGGMDLGRYAEVLDLGLSATLPTADILQAVASATPSLTPDDCRRLAYNGWSLENEWIFSDEHPGWLEKTAATLTRAAALCPAAAVTERARLDIIAMSARLEAESTALKAGHPPSPALAAAIDRVRRIIADEALAISAADDLEGLDESFFRLAAKLDPAHSADLEPAWFHLMDAIAADPRYSDADRLYAVGGKLVAAKALQPGGKIPAALALEAHQRVEAALALTTDPYTRTSLVNAALGVLDALDDQERSYSVLTAELKTSKTPYYYMSDLADLEEQRGHPDAAIEWLARSYRESQGQATRFQWGARYVRGLVRMRPKDEARIRDAANQVLSELDGGGRLYGRSSGGLLRLAKALHDWNAAGDHAAAIRDVHAQIDGICRKLPSGDSALVTCARVLQAV